MPCDKHPFLAVGPCGKCGRLKCPVCACDACADENDDITPLRVASWNIKTLGKQFHHNQPAVTKLLAAVMLRMNADVICLMEVMEGFGLKHAVSIVEEMNQISTIRWRVRFPGTYTGTGGRNGLETYAVVYNPDLFELVSFKLVGAEIPYSKDESGKRRPVGFSNVVTRRPAEAVFRPLPTNRHFSCYPEFRVIIFHAPSVAPKDYFLACHAISELKKLPVFANPKKFPYTILCADLNLDEEAANHVQRREAQAYDDMVVKPKEQAAKHIENYNLAYQNYMDALNALTEHRQLLAQKLDEQDPVAQCAQNVLDLEFWAAEELAATNSKGKKRDIRFAKAKLQQQEISQLLESSTLELKNKAQEILNERKELERAVMEADERLELAEERADPHLPTSEEEVLNLAEVAFEPLTDTGMCSNLSYSDDFRTTLRMSVHAACTRQPRAKHYDEELTFEHFVCSNFDQVLVRTDDGCAWGDLRAKVINILGAVMPDDVRNRLVIGSTSMPPMTAGLWDHLREAAESNSALHKELTDAFGEDPSGIEFNSIVLDAPLDGVIDEGDDDPVEHDYEPIKATVLNAFLAEPEVFASALVSAFKRFVAMNNSHPHIDLVRREAAASASEPDPIVDFFNKANLWNNQAKRNAVKYVPEQQRLRLFSINVYLALANVLSDHLPVIVEIEIVEPTLRLPLTPVPLRFPSLFDLPHSSPIMGCPNMSRHFGPCQNLKNCCGTCDERTSLKTADGCLTGYQLVRLAAKVCQKFIALHRNTGLALVRRQTLQIVGGQHWTAMAGHLLYVKRRSSAFAIAHGTEYFRSNSNILIGESGIQVERELCSIKNELAARKHPRILFAGKSKAKVQILVDIEDDDDVDVQDEDIDQSKKKNDWSYPRIGKEFGAQNPVKFAKDVLSFLRTGVCPTQDPALRQALAALLVTIFGVEANKDNSTYLTAILLLLGIEMGRYTVGEAFYQVDSSNECNLAGSLGLFPLASSERSNLYGKRRCISGKATDMEPGWSEAKIMTTMLNIQPRCRDNIILKKEMVLLVDDVRARFSFHRTCKTEDLLKGVYLQWLTDLHGCYIPKI
jgi:endonuclease/exonuclease/phosphatase family metal-dependent hydrolase